MSVLIKDMEKPKFCYAIIDGEFEYCPFVNTDDDCVLLLKKGICESTWQGQYSKCPLIEAPELCEDTISRKMAIDAVKASTPFCVVPDDHHISAVDMEFRISNLPSVTPKRNDGKWIHDIVNNYTEKHT